MAKQTTKDAPLETVDFADIVLRDSAAYSLAVVTDRAIPDARDGLKPVQRRIIYAMQTPPINAKPSGPHLKSMRIAGETMGKYHPHGDSSIYDAMVVQAQGFARSVPLVDGKGNWGSSDGDSAASARYTEARLTWPAYECTQDLHVVQHVDNYDGRFKEPVLLPMVFPNLIVNGQQGIAVGYSTNSPNHNLGEAIDACILMLDNPEADDKAIRRKLPAPDFPSGGLLVEAEGLDDYYKGGKGRFTLEAKWHIEQITQTQQGVVITELPYGVTPTTIISDIRRGVQAEKITQVAASEVPHKVMHKSGLLDRLIIRCRRGGDPHLLAEELLAHTAMRRSYNPQCVALVNERPKQIGIREQIQIFLEMRMEVVEARLRAEKEERLARYSTLAARSAAAANIQKVVEIVRKSRDNEHTDQQLVKLLKWKEYNGKGKTGLSSKLVAITLAQAAEIRGMRVDQINQLNRFKLEEEIEAVLARVMEIDRILKDPKGVSGIVRDELLAFKKAYAVPRKTEIRSGKGARKAAQGPQAAAGQEVIYLLSRKGHLKLRGPRGGGKAPSDLVGVGRAVTGKPIRVWTADGNCLGPILSGPVSLPLSADAVFADFDTPAEYYMLVTSQGKTKRIKGDLVSAVPVGGMQVMSLDSGDRIVAVIAHTDEDTIMLHAASGMTLRYKTSIQNVVKGGAAGGVRGMKLAEGDEIVAAHKAEGKAVLILHKSGNGKLVSLDEYPVQGRDNRGVISSDPSKPARNPAGPVVSVLTAKTKKEILAYDKSGESIAIKLPGMEKRHTVAKPLLKTEPDGLIVDPLS